MESICLKMARVSFYLSSYLIFFFFRYLHLVLPSLFVHSKRGQNRAPDASRTKSIRLVLHFSRSCISDSPGLYRSRASSPGDPKPVFCIRNPIWTIRTRSSAAAAIVRRKPSSRTTTVCRFCGFTRLFFSLYIYFRVTFEISFNAVPHRWLNHAYICGRHKS